MRATLLLVVTTIMLTIAYRSSNDENAQTKGQLDEKAADQTVDLSSRELPQNTKIETQGTNQLFVTLSFHDLHKRLLAMDEPDRNHVLWLTLRDTGLACDEVASSNQLAAGVSAWRVTCEGVANYSVAIDEFGSITVIPIPYGDFDEIGIREILRTPNPQQ